MRTLKAIWEATWIFIALVVGIWANSDFIFATVAMLPFVALIMLFEREAKS